MNKLNTTYEIETLSGEKLKLTLSYRYLYQLRAKHREQYADFNRIMTTGAKDMFDNLTVLYTGYLCQRVAETGDTEGAMSFDDFMDACPASGRDAPRAKKNDGFRRPFIRRTRKNDDREPWEIPPKFEVEDVEDAFTYYVLLLGVPETIFWDADISFLLGVVEDKAAYDGWDGYVQRRRAKRRARKAQRKRRR